MLEMWDWPLLSIGVGETRNRRQNHCFKILIILRNDKKINNLIRKFLRPRYMKGYTVILSSIQKVPNGQLRQGMPWVIREGGHHRELGWLEGKASWRRPAFPVCELVAFGQSKQERKVFHMGRWVDNVVLSKGCLRTTEQASLLEEERQDFVCIRDQRGMGNHGPQAVGGDGGGEVETGRE